MSNYLIVVSSEHILKNDLAIEIVCPRQIISFWLNSLVICNDHCYKIFEFDSGNVFFQLKHYLLAKFMLLKEFNETYTAQFYDLMAKLTKVV